MDKARRGAEEHPEGGTSQGGEQKPKHSEEKQPASDAAVAKVQGLRVEDMANILLTKLGKAGVKRPAAHMGEGANLPAKKARGGGRRQSTNQKPATGEGASPPASKGKLSYPGTDRKPPMQYKNFKIYTTKDSWRIQKIGDKLDQAFSFKRDDPEVVWARVAAYVRKGA